MSDFTLETLKAEDVMDELDAEEVTDVTDNQDIDPEVLKQAEQNAAAIFETDFDDPSGRQTVMKPLDNFGSTTMAKSAQRNKLVEKRMVDLGMAGKDAGDVGSNLSQLHMQIKDLDPGPLDFMKKGFLGRFFNPVRKYFDKYQKADSAIADIVKSLDKGAKILSNDNVTLQGEEASLRELTEKLMADIELGRAMDAALETQIANAQAEGADPAKISFVKEEILFPLRQRIMDMQSMIVVNQQGIMSMNVIRRNNKELIRGVERAKNVTVTALRTGVTVASALYNQKVLIQKIQTLNETTENIIESTSRMLREQGGDIQRQSMDSMISVDVLKTAFADALQAIEDISSYRENALPQMQKSIDEFRAMAAEGQEVVDRLERADM